MSSLILAQQSSSPGTPSAGKARSYFDNSNGGNVPKLKLLGPNGTPITQVDSAQLLQSGNAADVVATSADTYLGGLLLPAGVRAAAGGQYRFVFAMTKNNLGTATPIFTVRFGTAGAVGDTARLTFTLLAQTAAIDTGRCEINVNTRAYSATGTIAGTIIFTHNGTTTGLANAAQPQIQQAVSASFDTTVDASYLGVSCNPGASAVWTFNVVQAAAFGVS